MPYKAANCILYHVSNTFRHTIFQISVTESVKKHELKLQLANRGLDVQEEKGDLRNRLTKVISEISNDEEKRKFATKSVNM